MMGILSMLLVLLFLPMPSYAQEVEDVRVNQIQMKGTHNSYHVLRPFHPYRILPIWMGESFLPWDYEHDDMATQLGQHGVRSIELDIHYRKGKFPVYHIYGLDDGSNCEDLEVCLSEIRDWSDENPDHHVLMLYIEPKDRDDPKDLALRRFVADHFDELEAVIMDSLGADKVYTPQQFRGEYDSLLDRVAAEGWPTVDETRGMVMVVWNDPDEDRDHYLEYGDDIPSNLVMFLRSTREEIFEGEHYNYDGVFTSIDDAKEEEDQANLLIEMGFIVRTSADDRGLKGDQARKGDRSLADAALKSGAQIVTTDIPNKHEDFEYWLDIPDGRPSRCNPVNAPDGCISELIELWVPDEPEEEPVEKMYWDEEL